MRETTEITVRDIRDKRYGEFLVIKPTGLDCYNTTGLNDCPAELWDALDPAALAKEFGAAQVQLNGPHYWMMDEQTLHLGEIQTFGGIEARWAAHIPPEALKAVLQKDAQGAAPYTLYYPKKRQKMRYLAGRPVFELVDPEGHAYVLQAHEAELPIETLPQLGQKLKGLPDGWEYRSRVLEEDLVLDLSPDETIYAVGDEFKQYYTRI